jgi:hypothetical protein
MPATATETDAISANVIVGKGFGAYTLKYKVSEVQGDYVSECFLFSNLFSVLFSVLRFPSVRPVAHGVNRQMGV